MQLQLVERGQLALTESIAESAAVCGYRRLEVKFCAICRTDAKMWRDGHRDLVLPRVLGHELVCQDPDNGLHYVVWPGQTCGDCRYCRTGRENLCETMKIIGFHSDGGFSSSILVPEASLVPVVDSPQLALSTFAEPVGCLLNIFSRLHPQAGEHAVIIGGGVLGMLAALLLQRAECRVTVIEQNEEKLHRLAQFAKVAGFGLGKESMAAEFDLALNCCDSPRGFAQGVAKLGKGGRLGFFSGLKKNGELNTNLLNLIHYRELAVFGSYGPRYRDMVQAARFCEENQEVGLLVEAIIGLEEVESVLPRILSGHALKYIVTLEGKRHFSKGRHNAAPKLIKQYCREASPMIQQLIEKITPSSADFRASAQHKVDFKTKPLGSLGRIEELGVQLSVVQNTLLPTVKNPRMFVFAGDHGVVEEGVSAFPATVTVQMVQNFLAGGAAINVFCRQYGIDLKVVDMGVNGDFAPHPLLVDCKIARGTENFAVTRAMTREQAIAAIEAGAKTFLETYEREPGNLVGMGEMGIGNTSSAAAIICAATGLPVMDIVGRGTGVDDQGLQRKREVIAKALALHKPSPDDGLALMVAVGGYELAGICGATLAAAASGCVVVLDGIISTAAGLIAYLLCPTVKDYLVAGHTSVEVGQQAALVKMGLNPVIDLGFRLGEGTGAAITMNLVDLACRMMREMASFEEAGVDNKGDAP
jgi:nicotinate-nucleotide--dimethylbenzimidazole phosphoribosyltransferase